MSHACFIQFAAMLTSFVDIYFHQKNEQEREAALELRDAVLRLRRDGAFVAVPLWRVNLSPIGPHPVGTYMRLSLRVVPPRANSPYWLGSYEIWCPSESFASVFSYLCMNRGDLRYENRPEGAYGR